MKLGLFVIQTRKAHESRDSILPSSSFNATPYYHFLPPHQPTIYPSKMADGKKPTAGSGDTDFRKTWDRSEYAARAADHENKQKEESKARYEAKLAGKKYHRRASTPPDARDTGARTSRLNDGDQVGKTMLVPAG